MATEQDMMEVIDQARKILDEWRAQTVVAHGFLSRAGIGADESGLHVRVALLVKNRDFWERRARELEALCADRL